jgi:cation diffusion facilitator CzcD-associated flavoprotein CzcO
MAERATAPADYEVIIVGAGVAGICQLYSLVQAGLSVVLLEAASDLGGTWYHNRYPGCRFDSESYTYGFSFSEELLHEWDWKELFSPQPENLRYLNFVADKFGLRKYMQFNARVTAARWDDTATIWHVTTADGREFTSRFLVTALGVLSAPSYPRVPGIDTFQGQWWHTYNWPHEKIELAGKRVAVIGTGATGVQSISAIGPEAGELTVFQRRPNWCAPLSNRPIPPAEMARIKGSYDEIFELCSRTPGGMIHQPDRSGFYNHTPQERRAKWEELYGKPGFAVWLQNYREIFMEEAPNQEFSAFIAGKIRQRVHDPVVAEKLIPTDHGFGMLRVPMETRYYEVYNQDNVHLVDLTETPIERVTPTGVKTTEREYEFDIIVYATGFDAVVGPYDQIAFEGVNGLRLRDKWDGGPVTYLGLFVSGFPNLITIAGPQSASAATNWPRGIELQVDWVMELLGFMRDHGYSRVEAREEAEQVWLEHAAAMADTLLIRKARSWFNGHNTNIDGREGGIARPLIYNGGAPKFRKLIRQVADEGYQQFTFGATVPEAGRSLEPAEA